MWTFVGVCKCLYFFLTSPSQQTPGASATTVITVRFTVFRKRQLIWIRISHAPGNCLETLPLWKCGLTFKWGTLFQNTNKACKFQRLLFLPNEYNCICIIYMKYTLLNNKLFTPKPDYPVCTITTQIFCVYTNHPYLFSARKCEMYRFFNGPLS